MNDRLLTTKRVRSIIKTATNRHSVTIKSSKTRQFVWYSPLLRQHGPDLRRIEYLVRAEDQDSLINAMNEIDTMLTLHGSEKTNRSTIFSGIRIRFEIKALIK